MRRELSINAASAPPRAFTSSSSHCSSPSGLAAPRPRVSGLQCQLASSQASLAAARRARDRWRGGDAAGGEVPAGFPWRQRLRLQVHRRGRLPRPRLHHRHHHRCVRCSLQRRQSRSVSRFGLIDLVGHAGATSGIGAETARVLAKRGARVVIPARNVKAAEDMRARIRGECPGADVLVLPLDLSSLASVRAFADRFLSLGLPLHLLMYVRHSH